MSAKRQEINRITAVMKKHSEQLSSYPNVVGFGVGFKVKGGKKLDQLAIIVFVKKKIPLSDLKRHEVIPTKIKETLTDVQESGEIIAYPSRTDKWRPAPPGVSIGHYLITAGTFGCVALKNGVRKILSNNHVLANCNAANIGDAIYQPGVYDGGDAGDTIALLEDWIPIVFSVIANNLIDIATADPINDTDILDEILEIGIPTGVVEPELDMSVVKSGRTTAVTYGTITAIHATITVNYGAPGYARFIDQIVTTYMLAGGDSGSLLLTHPAHEAVGLCFAGSPTTSIASDIQYAKSLLDINIFTGVIDTSIDLYAKLVVAQDSADFLGKIIIRQPGSEDLSAKFKTQTTTELLGRAVIRRVDARELLARVEIGQDSIEVLCKGIIRHEAAVELLGKFSTKQVDITLDLLAKLNITHSMELLGKAIIRNIGSVDIPGKFITEHTGIPIDLLAKVNITHSMELLGKAIIKNVGSAGLLGKFTVRHAGIPIDLFAKVNIIYFTDLLARFEVGQDSTDLLGRVDIRQSVYSNLLAKTWLRRPYRLWTSRYYLNGVIELDEENLSDALLEYVIQGVMDDIKSRLINEGMLVYTPWTDITKTPKLIRRATTYGTVASLYSRDVNHPHHRIVMGLRPLRLRALEARAAQERAMDYWESRMEKMMQLYLTAGGRRLMIVDTEDEEAVFSMEDIPFSTEDPYLIKIRS